MPVSDAVVIGSGPNGLVAANLLADHGWDVTVLEAQESAGGAVRSDSDVHPGFVHDTSARSTRWRPRHRRSSRWSSRATAWSGSTPRPSRARRSGRGSGP